MITLSRSLSHTHTHTLPIMETFFWLSTEGVQLGKARNVAKHPTMHNIGPCPPKDKELPTQKVNSALSSFHTQVT